MIIIQACVCVFGLYGAHHVSWAEVKTFRCSLLWVRQTVCQCSFRVSEWHEAACRAVWNLSFISFTFWCLNMVWTEFSSCILELSRCLMSLMEKGIRWRCLDWLSRGTHHREWLNTLYKDITCQDFTLCFRTFSHFQTSVSLKVELLNLSVIVKLEC